MKMKGWLFTKEDLVKLNTLKKNSLSESNIKTKLRKLTDYFRINIRHLSLYSNIKKQKSVYST